MTITQSEFHFVDNDKYPTERIILDKINEYEFLLEDVNIKLAKRPKSYVLLSNRSFILASLSYLREALPVLLFEVTFLSGFKKLIRGKTKKCAILDLGLAESEYLSVTNIQLPSKANLFNVSAPLMAEYGFELILDLHKCNIKTFTRSSITLYFTQLCKVINMDLEQIHFWDDVNVPVGERQTSPKTVGTSAVAFILTSTIVIHTLDKLQNVFINIFSCKPFNADTAQHCTETWFRGKISNSWLVRRGVENENN